MGYHLVDPGSPQRAYNPEHAETDTHVLSIGAPSVDDGHVYDPAEGA